MDELEVFKKAGPKAVYKAGYIDALRIAREELFKERRTKAVKTLGRLISEEEKSMTFDEFALSAGFYDFF